MDYSKCINCKKPLKRGEFVTLNGGAMIKTKTGATMGDKNLFGFLTVNNHFDSKKNYQSLDIISNCSTGQFEFYACSHKCLAEFLTKQIMHLATLSTKIKKFFLASQVKLEKVGYEWGSYVTTLMGFKGALITDESTVSDFLSIGSNKSYEAYLKIISKKLGFNIKGSDYIWKIAKDYKKLLNKNFKALTDKKDK
jgi:hypothetical protein